MPGALTHPASMVLRKAFVDLSVGSLPSAGDNWPISVAQEINSPDSTITIYDTASVIHGRNMIDGVMDEHYGIQIRIRAADFTTGWAKVKAIQAAIDSTIQNTGVAISSNTYQVPAVTRKSGPISLGKEPTSKRSLWTINAVMAIRQIT